MTEQDKIRQEIKSFITELFLMGDENECPGDSDSFMKEGVIDSTGVLELVAFIEDKYGFSVEDDEMTPANLDSIDNLVIFISGKLG
ncbi:MAG: acyl carrier protein [Candidatus Krumholzibacteria bacterium]|nr:acyl carrier protein [Candidatus Krumholzibacteria bacterium]